MPRTSERKGTVFAQVKCDRKELVPLRERTRPTESECVKCVNVPEPWRRPIQGRCSSWVQMGWHSVLTVAVCQKNLTLFFSCEKEALIYIEGNAGDVYSYF